MHSYYGKTRLFLTAGFCAVIALTAGCSSGSSGSSTTTDDTDDTTSTTLALTGSVSTPSVATPNISALVAGGQRVSFVEEAPVEEGTEVHVFNLSTPPPDGNAIGECTTGTNGAFSCDCEPDDLEAGDQLLVIGGDSGDGHDDDIFLLVEAPEEGETMDLGAADFDSNQSWHALAAELEDLGIDFDSIDFADFDLDEIEGFDTDVHCFMELQNAQWENANPTEDGIGSDFGLLENLVAVALLEGIDVSPEDIMSGDIDDDTLQLLADAAETYEYGDSATYVAIYDTIVSDFDSVNGAFDDVFADEEVSDTSELNTTSDGGSICEQIEGNEDFLNQMIDTIHGCGDSGEFGNIFGSEEGFQSYYDYMNTYYIEGDADFEGYNPDAIIGMFGSYYDSHGGWDNFDDYDDDLYSMYGELPSGVDGEFDYHDWGQACGGMLWDAFESDPNGGYSAEDFQDWSGYWTVAIGEGQQFEDGADIDYFSTCTGELAEHGGFDYEICITDPEACTSYYEPIDGEGFDYAPPPPEGYDGGTCGDFACDFYTENPENCSIDCGYTAPPPPPEGEVGGEGGGETGSSDFANEENCTTCVEGCTEAWGSVADESHDCNESCTSYGWCAEMP